MGFSVVVRDDRGQLLAACSKTLRGHGTGGGKGNSYSHSILQIFRAWSRSIRTRRKDGDYGGLFIRSRLEQFGFGGGRYQARTTGSTAVEFYFCASYKEFFWIKLGSMNHLSVFLRFCRWSKLLQSPLNFINENAVFDSKKKRKKKRTHIFINILDC